jgi:hypothetical protein
MRRKIFGWLIPFKFSAGIRLSRKKFGGGAAHTQIFRRGGWRRRRRGLQCLHLSLKQNTHEDAKAGRALKHSRGLIDYGLFL